MSTPAVTGKTGLHLNPAGATSLNESLNFYEAQWPYQRISSLTRSGPLKDKFLVQSVTLFSEQAFIWL
jgi:hypothetical protein